jgi:hypothetical protein
MVAKLKNEGCQSGGTGFDFRLHYMLHMLSYVHQGGIHVPEKYFTYVTEHVAVVNMLHMPSYIHQGGWEGVLTFLTTCNKDYPHKRFKMAQVNHRKYFY